MKRKKYLQEAPILADGGTIPTDAAKEKESYLITSLNRKIMVLLALLSWVIGSSQAKSDNCKAGYYCVDGKDYPCLEGYYSLEGDKKCKICPEGSLISLNISSTLNIGFACQKTDEEPVLCSEGYFAMLGYTECKICSAGSFILA